MKLIGPDGDSFELSLTGYQFPNYTPRGSRDERANRLNVSIEAGISQIGWRASHPCLTTWQMEELVDWADKLTDPDAPHGRLLFADPELTFQYGGKRSGSIVLEVYFGGGFMPPRRAYYNFEEDHAWATLVVPPADAIAWADSLRAELAKFPAR